MGNVLRGAFTGAIPHLASATSANGTARTASTAVSTQQMEPGTISFLCQATIVTGSVVATFNIQVSDDGTTYYDLKTQNNAANVTVTATGNVVLSVPMSASGWLYVRCTATLSGAATAAGDLTQVDLRFLRFDELL